jgi:hypothetical protein
MTTLYCAKCGNRFEPDDDHVRIDAEHRRIDDRNEHDEYVMHPDCWHELTAEWTDPV